MLIAGTLAFLVLVPLMYSLYGGSSSKVFVQRNMLRNDVQELQQAVRKKEAVQKKLTEYLDQSLPPNATTHYKYSDILWNLMKESGFQDFKVNSTTNLSSATSRSNRNGYQTFSYKLTGTASLEGLTNLLKQFYGTPLLQVIKSLSIKPLDQSNRMAITIDIEAIALDTAKRQTNIDWVYNPDAEQTLSDYVRQVNERALFSVYRPPMPPAPPDVPPLPPKEPSFTEAMHTIVAFISDVNGRYEVHLDRRLKGDKLRLKVGDRFEIDGTDCIVREIRFDRITIGIVDEEDPSEEILLSVRLGKSFNDFDDPT